MLRLIENDIKIKMIKVNHETINIDTLDDFKKAVKTFKNDKLKKLFMKKDDLRSISVLKKYQKLVYQDLISKSKLISHIRVVAQI